MNASTLERKSFHRIKGQEGFIFIDDGGDGEIPVIFSHSFGGDATHWKHQLEHLRPSRRAIAFDFRGHGRSDKSSNNRFSAEALAGDIAAVAESLDIAQFILVGHSMGGSAAIAYANSHPTRVMGLVLVGTPGKTPTEISKPVASALESENYQKVMDDYMKQLMEGARPVVSSLVTDGVSKLSRETSISIIRALFEFDPIDMLNRFTNPKLIISTTREAEQPNALYHQVAGTPYKIIEGTSHWPQLDKPDEFNKIIDQFLTEVNFKNQ